MAEAITKIISLALQEQSNIHTIQDIFQTGIDMGWRLINILSF